MFLLTPTATAAEESEALRAATARVVRVIAVSETGRQFGGTGVIVASDEVVTNCHVTRIARKITVLSGRQLLSATTQRADSFHDLCLLRVPGLRAEDLPAEDSALALGAHVWAMGFANDRGLSVNEGEVLAQFPMDGASVLQVDAEFSHGMSGGGLFDERGLLRGLLTFFRTADKVPPSFFVVPIGWMEQARKLPALDIAPQTESPFWARALAQQPWFLQAGALEAAGHWPDMLKVAREWTRADPADPNAWIMLGRAARQAADMEGMQLALNALAKLALGQSRTGQHAAGK